MANTDVRLALFENNNFGGRRILFRRGGIAVRDMDAFRFNDQLSSFRLRNVSNSRQVTLILFSDNNFRGTRRVFRGNTNQSSLNGFNDQMSSFIVVGRRLSNDEINAIQGSASVPRDILFVRS